MPANDNAVPSFLPRPQRPYAPVRVRISAPFLAPLPSVRVQEVRS